MSPAPDVGRAGRPAYPARPTNGHQHNCRTKKRYLSLAQAEAKAVIVNRKHNRGRGLEPYLCTKCGKFHLGHARPGRRGTGARTLLPRRPTSKAGPAV